MNIRLKEFRKELNLTQDQLGQKIGLTGGHISDIEHGRKTLTERTIKVLCQEFHLNESWLRFGEGEMLKDSYEALFKNIENSQGYDELDKAIVNLYLGFPAEVRKVIKEGLKNLAEKIN